MRNPRALQNRQLLSTFNNLRISRTRTTVWLKLACRLHILSLMNTKLSFLVPALVSALALATGCAANVAPDDLADGDEAEASAEALTGSFVSTGTGYFPDASELEGGFNDMRGAKLRTLQQFLNGDADYVSVAMDKGVFPYGTTLSIRELNDKHGRQIPFRVVDTGGAFRGKGKSRIDICTANSRASLDPTINGTLHITVGGASQAPAQDARPSGSSCRSKTLSSWVDSEVCVQSRSDSRWYQCVDGIWKRGTSSSGPFGECTEAHSL
jgi:3D (Asp-Asp-Asp) domain-containing protein